MKPLTFVLITLVISTFSHILSSKELLILGADNKPPKYFNRNGLASGFVVEMTQYIMQHTEQDYKIELFPWKRAYTKALRGDGAIFGLSKNQARLALFDYSKAMYYNDLMLVVRKNNIFKFEHIADLKGKRISVLNGASYGDEFEQAVKDNMFILHEHSDPISGINMLLRERVDAVIYGPGKIGVELLILRNAELMDEKDKLTTLLKPFHRDANYLGIPKQLKMETFLDAFNDGIDKGYDTGDFDEIIKRYQIK